MNWLEVYSSNVAAVAYESDIATLTVRYKDGSVYVRPNVTATQFGALMTAPSKGKFLAAMTGQAICIQPTSAECGNVVMASIPGREAAHTGPLNVIDEDAGKCCSRRLLKMLANPAYPTTSPQRFHCGECGAEMVSEMVGTVRHWRIVEHVAVVRPRG
jgi:hypothetical protein